MEKFLITGFTGQVGSQMADFLLENTDGNIYGMMRWQEPQENIRHLNLRINQKDRVFIEYADLIDFPSIFRLINKVKPDFIFHLAAQSYPKTSFDIPIETLTTNIIGTGNILEAIRQVKEINKTYNPVVHICSSSEVYGRTAPDVHLTEDTPFNASSPYSISKIGTDYLGQFYGKAYGIQTFITRMGTHSGPRRSDVFFESTVAKQIALIEAKLQEPIIYVGNLDSIRTYQDARDAIKAYYLLSIKMKEGGIQKGDCFNIAGEECFRLEEIIDILLSFTEVKNIKIKQIDERMRPIDASYQMFDNTKIRNTINWKPEISVKKMLKDLLNHWRAEINIGNIPLNR